MSMIFAEFPSLEKAKAFAHAVRALGGWRGPAIFTDHESATLHDPHPVAYNTPAVHVQRGDDFEDDAAIIALAKTFGGVFVGT